jgi:predicted Zn-dependent protease
MDLQNIATHEFGHAVGLGDIYDTACSSVTMYGYSDYGDTVKRTLETPDITGLRTLYGI